MTARAFVLLALLATPALADEIPFSPAATEACLQDRPLDVGCIGDSASACIETEAGSSNVGIGACWRAEGDYWQARLDAVLSRLAEGAAQDDALLDEAGSAAGRQGPALEAMRAAFDAYLSARCDYEGSLWQGGSGTGPAIAHCRMMMTGMQALSLETGSPRL
ncbi:MAG: DUF1311 domain-containing protein [Rhodobacter sp.]|nr:DUF1311 domain-containing protein [Paracoccaceae bacterium]MCC0075000.1 DUF1311 domain-containing protein [Rhodobacter sp.]